VVRFRIFNFPGWTAFLDEKRCEIKTEGGTGAILLDVPGGRHRIRIVFRDTPVRLAGKLISFTTAIALIVISIPWTNGQRVFINQQGDGPTRGTKRTRPCCACFPWIDNSANDSDLTNIGAIEKLLTCLMGEDIY
jgi:hypothetical protein